MARASMALGLWIALVLGVASCTPVRPSEYAADPIERPRGGVTLDLGKRYAVVGSGGGVVARAAADPASPAGPTYGFATVVSTTGEVSGADGKVWRRIEDGYWAPRDGLFVFASVRDAALLATELRVYAPRELRRTIQNRDLPPRPPTPAPAKVAAGSKPAPTPPPKPPTAPPTPAPSPTSRSQALPSTLFAVIPVGGSRLFDRPGGEPSDRPHLEAGEVVAIVDEAIGVDGRRALRTDSNLWLPTEGVAIVSLAAQAAALSYDVTMRALAPDVEIHPDAAPALWLLRREPRTRYLAEAIREQRVPVRGGRLSSSASLASYSFRDRAITIAEDGLAADVRLIATSLAHEAVHAWEHERGLTLDSSARCFEAELRAFRVQADLWESFHGPNGKANPGNDREKEENELLALVRKDPEALKLRLVRLYGDQCGYHGPVPAASPAATPRPGQTAPAKATPAPAPTRAKLVTP